MSALTAQQQDLFAWLQASLPRWIVGTTPSELYSAMVKIFDAARQQIDAWFIQTYMSRSVGAWLDEHGKDRGQPRQNNETDAAYFARLIVADQAITVALLTLAINAILAVAGITTSVAFTSLRQDYLFLGVGTDGFARGYASRGYRVTNAIKPNRFVAILPYGTPVATQAAVAALLGAKKPAGMAMTIEKRANP